MSTFRRISLLSLVSVVWLTTPGCVSRDEYLREKFSANKAKVRADELERDLADERNRVIALESQNNSMRDQLETKTALADTLKQERAHQDEYIARLKGDLEELSKTNIGDIKVVEVKLPAELDRVLKEFAGRFPDEVEYDPHRGAVRWKSDLTFAKGSDEVRSNARASLQSFAEIVRSAAAQAFEIVVVGHTDNLRIGPVTGRKHPTNWHLSVHRAIAVKDVLARSGVPNERLGVMGYGEFRPRVPNPKRGGAEANRRVEIFLVSSREQIPGDETVAQLDE